MELKWLEDFLVLARTKNFTRAAAERNVTQSALSRRIRALESWLGQPVIDRSNYPASLTKEGEIFKVIAENVFTALHDVRRDFKKQIVANTLSISAPHTLSTHLIPRWISGMPPAIKNCNVQVQAGNFHDCIQTLLDGNCDLLVTYFDPKVPIDISENEFTYVSIGYDHLIPVSAPDENNNPIHALTDNPASELKFLSYEKDTFLDRSLNFFLKDQGGGPKLDKCYESALAEGLKSMAMTGRGLGWIPQSCVAEELTRGRLVRAGSVAWDVKIELRVYMSRNNANRIACELWRHLEKDTE